MHLRLPEVQGRTGSSQDSLVVRVTTNAGTVGYGEVDSRPFGREGIIEAPAWHLRTRGLREIRVGEDPLETGRLWDPMYQSTLYFGREGPAIQAMAFIDLALWDIKGKALGLPIVSLLGGAYRKSVRAYASHMFDFEPKVTARRASEAAEAGVTAVKFGWEPMGPDPALDEELVRGVRQAVGPDVQVCIEAGLAWDAKTAGQWCGAFQSL